MDLSSRLVHVMDRTTANNQASSVTSPSEPKIEPIGPLPTGYPWIILGVAMLLAVAYVARFHGNPAGDPDSWGQFGDFLGGLLNPLVGIITVLLILETLRITRKEAQDNRIELARQHAEMEKQTKELVAQRANSDAQREAAEEQLRTMRKREELQEIQKCLDALTTELTKSLKETTTRSLCIGGSALQPNMMRAGARKIDAISEINLADVARMREKKTAIDRSALQSRAAQRSAVDSHISEWGQQFHYQIELIKEAAHYCLNFERIAESETWSLYYYKNRAYRTAQVMAALGLVSDDVKAALLPVASPALNDSDDSGNPSSDESAQGEVVH